MAAPAAAFAGGVRPALAAPVGAMFAALAFGATLWGWLSGGGSFETAWAPALDLRFAVELDGLAALYSLLATGVGFLVLVYSRSYLPLHIRHERESGEGSPGGEVGFYFFMLLFMGAMVGIAVSQDLILFFVFWDVTAICSYYLIAFDWHREDARSSALMALILTAVTAVLLLIGAVILYARYQTFSIPGLIQVAEPGLLLTTAAALMTVAGLAKSAQAPLQFWLPRAMAAPTPVSAYLHSAAMVAAGVLLIGRLYPLIARSDALLDALVVVGLASILVGGILALTRDTMKLLLAYSTISQYGYVVLLYGLGGEYGAVGASFYVLAHAFAKSALFMTAGAVTEATGETEISQTGGLLRSMPVLAAASGVAAAGIAALPLTIGFFKDELLFNAALERGPFFVGLALAATILTLAYIWRFWNGIFLGERRAEAKPIPHLLVAPVVVLGLLVLLGGLVVEPFAQFSKAAGSAYFPGSVESVEPAYHLDLRAANLLALGTYALGALLIASRPGWERGALLFAWIGERAGPERLYNLGVEGLNGLSDRLHTVEVRDLRGRVAAILVPSGVLVGLALVATPSGEIYTVGGVGPREVPLLLALFSAAVATVATCLVRRHVTLALVLSGAGYSIAVAFAFFGAPDVALVAVLVETVITLLILGTLKLMPREILESATKAPVQHARRKAVVAVVSGLFVLAVTWGALSRPTPERSAAESLTGLAPEAHAKDVVTVILTDFRALDTLGEVTVVALVLLGVATLLFKGKLP